MSEKKIGMALLDTLNTFKESLYKQNRELYPQLKKIDDLVREAMGFSQERGDTLNVVNTPFNDAAEDSLL